MQWSGKACEKFLTWPITDVCVLLLLKDPPAIAKIKIKSEQWHIHRLSSGISV